MRYVLAIALLLALCLLGWLIVRPSSHGGQSPPLTSEERTAWEKFRREQPKPAYGVFGYLPKEGRWMTLTFSRETGQPTWTPGRGQTFSDVGHGGGEVEKAEHNEQQEARWLREAEEELKRLQQKARREKEKVGRVNARTESDIQVCRERIASCRASLLEYRQKKERLKAKAPEVERGIDQAREQARDAAAEPAVKVVAIVEMYAGADPAPVSWFVDEGKGVQESKTPPYPDLAGRLRDHLLRIQKSAGER